MTETLKLNSLIITKPTKNIDQKYIINEPVIPIEYTEISAVVRDMEAFKKTEYVENVYKLSSKHPYGCIYISADIISNKVDTVTQNDNVLEFKRDSMMHVI